jgi:benzodiazapine receptor
MKGVIKMKIQWKPFLIALAVPLAVGGIAGFISSSSIQDYQQLIKPPFSPPGWLFPIVWTILYILMGLASYFVYVSRRTRGRSRNENKVHAALDVYAAQLAFNFFWTIWFFNLKLYFFAFAWLVVMWVLILAAILLFSKISKKAAWLMVPYLAWVTFAGYLNLGTAILN